MEATYCPEDNKLRLYCGRVSREWFERLRKGRTLPAGSFKREGTSAGVAMIVMEK